MRVAPVARLSQLGCLCLTTWIVVTMRVPAMFETPRGVWRDTHAPPSKHTPCHRVSHLHYS
jgi:hypothetical protein